MNAREIRHIKKKLRQLKRDKRRALQRAATVLDLTGNTRLADSIESLAQWNQFLIEHYERQLP